MLFSLATSWENDLIDNVADLNQAAVEGQVFELYDLYHIL